MSIVYKIPIKQKIVVETLVIPAILNTPVANGTFQIDYEARYVLTDITKNSVYLFERLSLTTNINENDYQDALINSKIPKLSFFKKSGEVELSKKSFPIIGYSNARDISIFVYTNNTDDYILCRLSGALDQTPELIGRQTVNFLIDVNIFQIDNTEFNKNHRQELELDYGKDIRQ